jgi:transposase-like protein
MVLVGTVFERTRTPLTTWFAPSWYMTNQKTAGVSAQGLMRAFDLGSYQTAWTMLHKYRSAMVRPGRELLRGDVEVDETLVGGSKPGVSGRGAQGKTLVMVAVEVPQPRGFGRMRLKAVPDASKDTLTSAVTETIERGSVVLTDGWAGYNGLSAAGYTHKPVTVAGSGSPAHVPLPAVHRVASLFKRSLLNAYQQYPKLHLQSYLDEWVFRFNPRPANARGLLFFRLMERAVAADPLPYHDLAASSRPRRVSPMPPGTGGSRRAPPVNDAPRPWRSTPDHPPSRHREL